MNVQFNADIIIKVSNIMQSRLNDSPTPSFTFRKSAKITMFDERKVYVSVSLSMRSIHDFNVKLFN